MKRGLRWQSWILRAAQLSYLSYCHPAPHLSTITPLFSSNFQLHTHKQLSRCLSKMQLPSERSQQQAKVSNPTHLPSSQRFRTWVIAPCYTYHLEFLYCITGCDIHRLWVSNFSEFLASFRVKIFWNSPKMFHIGLKVYIFLARMISLYLKLFEDQKKSFQSNPITWNLVREHLRKVPQT